MQCPVEGELELVPAIYGGAALQAGNRHRWDLHQVAPVGGGGGVMNSNALFRHDMTIKYCEEWAQATIRLRCSLYGSNYFH